MRHRMNNNTGHAADTANRSDHALSCLFKHAGDDRANTQGSLATWDLDRLGRHLRRDIGLECGR